MRNRIKGMFIGGAIGDAWGLAVETWTPERIFSVHPNGLPRFVQPIGHKWYKSDMPLGKTSDDTQLHKATTRGLILGKKQAEARKSFDPYLTQIAEQTVKASLQSTEGWGKTTQEAVRRLANGVNWSKSGQTTEIHRGTGNGVVMKCSSMGAWFDSETAANFNEDNGEPFNYKQRLVDLSAMTHYTQMSAHACVMHTYAVRYCLLTRNFDPLAFASMGVFTAATDYSVEHLNEVEDDIFDRTKIVRELCDDFPTMNREQIVEKLGTGSCYVYDSLPFTYAFFLKNPSSMSTIREVVEAGGDTDTNAKMVGELIGALNGIELFEKPENRWAMEQLPETKELLELADEFCDTFGIE